MRHARGGVNWAVASALPLLLGACAGVPRDASIPINDPNERLNRHVMAANQEILRPASEVVKTAIPGPVHDRLRDLNSNLKEPRIFVNNVLQGRFEAAHTTAAPLSRQFDLWRGWALRYRKPRGPAAEERRFRPDVVCLGRRRGPVRGATLSGPVDAARCGRIGRGYVQRTRSAGRSDRKSPSPSAPQSWMQRTARAN